MDLLPLPPVLTIRVIEFKPEQPYPADPAISAAKAESTNDFLISFYSYPPLPLSIYISVFAWIIKGGSSFFTIGDNSFS